MRFSALLSGLLLAACGALGLEDRAARAVFVEPGGDLSVRVLACLLSCFDTAQNESSKFCQKVVHDSEIDARVHG